MFKTTPHLNCIDAVREWLGRCNKLHGDTCVPMPVAMRQWNEVPTWVIDTEQDCIVPGTMADRYIALSYVWPENQNLPGAIRNVLLLDKARTTEFQTPGFLNSEEALLGIPDVIKYTMQFTRRINERYLWIDRLCIEQNDKATQDEVMRMDKIYHGAYLTLIAAAPEWQFSEKLKSDWQPFLYVNATPEHLYELLSRSQWSQRGWTFQEQILCRRALILMDSGIFWDCQCSIWWDYLYLEDSKSPTTLLSQPFTGRWWPDFSFYMDLVCLFNNRHFTYPQDALAAFSGVLQAMAPVFPGGFVSGLPSLFLDEALIWQPYTKATRRFDRSKPDAPKVHNVSSLPSWSWCGWKCSVDPRSLLSGLQYIDRQEINWRSGTWRTRSLVEWQMSERDQEAQEMSRKVQVVVECTLGDDATNDNIPHGWERHLLNDKPLSQDRIYYTHEKDGTTRFKKPIPISGDAIGLNKVQRLSYLSCVTSTATFLSAAVLSARDRRMLDLCATQKQGYVKVSASEARMSRETLAFNDHCSVLVLQQPDGTFSGLLRKADDTKIAEGVTLNLCAISTGSASTADMVKSFEWNAFEQRRSLYNTSVFYEPEINTSDALTALNFDISMAFDRAVHARFCDKRNSVQCTCEQYQAAAEARNEHIDIICWACQACSEFSLLYRRDIRDGCSICPTIDEHRMKEALTVRLKHQREVRYKSSLPKIKICEFYNVLWVEDQDGIAYRRACGWVPKHIWEANASKPVKITLG